MNQIRLHGRIVKSKEGLNEGVLNSHALKYQLSYHNSLEKCDEIEKTPLKNV